MMQGNDMVFGVSDFVAYLNQTLELAYPFVTIEGELTGFRVKGRWVYFDLKDQDASVRFFGTVYALPGPLEDGMVVRVSGSPRLHPLYGFSVTFQTIQPVGEGALRRAADLLAAKLEAEGLFDVARKRSLPYPPRRVALVTAADSAAYADFIKILHARWRGITVDHYNVLVQGESAPAQIAAAIAMVNAAADPADVLVLTRGGGSAEDLAAFNTEAVVRAVAASRVPTLAAIGHEVDVSLAELAADRRASTPSNAAELLTPDRTEVLRQLKAARGALGEQLTRIVTDRQGQLRLHRIGLDRALLTTYDRACVWLQARRQLVQAYDPSAALRRGYALVHDDDGALVRHIDQLAVGDSVQIVLSGGHAAATITDKEQADEEE